MGCGVTKLQWKHLFHLGKPSVLSFKMKMPSISDKTAAATAAFMLMSENVVYWRLTRWIARIQSLYLSDPAAVQGFGIQESWKICITTQVESVVASWHFSARVSGYSSSPWISIKPRRYAGNNREDIFYQMWLRLTHLLAFIKRKISRINPRFFIFLTE